MRINDKFLNLQSPLFVNGMNFETNNFQKILKIECAPLQCNNMDLENIIINYRIFGQNKIYSNNIKFWNNDLKIDTFNSNYSMAIVENCEEDYFDSFIVAFTNFTAAHFAKIRRCFIAVVYYYFVIVSCNYLTILGLTLGILKEG